MSVLFTDEALDLRLMQRLLFAFVFLLEGLATADLQHSGGYIRKPPVCVDIPTDLKLCHDVGYPRMILPNLLNHESLDEVRQQASSFVPLLRQNCHPFLKEFLCSLFAPVCLEPDSAYSGPIPPCKSLCKKVERSCIRIMQLYHFNWPAMLNCSKFTDMDPCVNLDVETPSSTLPPRPRPSQKICAPCGTELELDILYDNYCASEFVLKIKAKKIKAKKGKGIRTITADRKRRVVYKQGPLSKRDLRRLKLVVHGSRKCSCPPLDLKPTSTSKRKKKGKKNKAFFLVMGHKAEGQLIVTVLHSWPKKNKILKKAHKNNFNARNCPEFGNAGTS